MDTMLNLLDTVIAATNFPEYKVLAGDLGADRRGLYRAVAGLRGRVRQPRRLDARAADPGAFPGAPAVAGRRADHAPDGLGGVTPAPLISDRPHVDGAAGEAQPSGFVSFRDPAAISPAYR